MYLKLREVAEKLNVHRNTIQLLCERGEIPAIKVGAQTRIPEEELNKYIERQRQNFTK